MSQMCIVLARVDEDHVIVKHGRIDLGERHSFKSVPRPVAMVWSSSGNDVDVSKAKQYAQREGYRVFVYEVGESDPLGRARRDVLVPSS